MANYHYRVIDGEGEVQTGILEALNTASAAEELRRRGWLPVEVSPGGKTLSMRLNEPVQFFDKAGEREVCTFLRDLARLLRAGLAIDDALKLLVTMQSKNSFVRVLEDVREQIRRGESLAAALSRHKELFPVQIIASVQAGETAGALPEALNAIATTLERSVSFRQRLRSALMYPMILMVMVAGSFALVITFVIPQFGPLFAGNEDKLPWVTRFVMSLAAVVSEYWWLIFLALIAGLFALVAALHDARLRKQIIAQICRLGPIRSWIYHPDVIRFTRTLGVCTQSGLALDKAIAMANDTVKIPHLGEELAKVRALVRRGELLSSALSKVNWFPALVLQFIKVGEQSGNLGELLTESAQILSEDYEARLERALEVFSPVMTLIMGGVVALLVGSVLLGMMSINDVAF